MSPVALILVSSEDPGWLLDISKEALLGADAVFLDAAAPPGIARPWLRSQARQVRVGATARDRELARREMLRCCQRGERVARVYWQSTARDASVLRDTRRLRDAHVPFEIFPGVDPNAVGWSHWIDERPLFGLQVAVLRMTGQASETAALLRDRGALPWVMPTIELHAPPEPALLQRALRELASYAMVVFTSANGVEQTFREVHGLGLDTRAFGGLRVAAIGSVTARRLAERGIVADVVAESFRAEALAEAIVEDFGEPAGKRVLLPRALEAREILPEMLREAGAVVDVVPAYQTQPPAAETMGPLRSALAEEQLDAVLLTASSTVTNLCKALGEGYPDLLASTCLASIGPITTGRARQLGLQVTVQAEEFTIPGVLAALEKHFS